MTIGHKSGALLLICAVSLAGCSSRPRNFAPVLGAAPVDQDAYEAHWLECRDRVAAITDKRSGRLTSAGSGAAAGLGAGVAAGAATSGATYGTVGAAAAAGAAMIAVVPIFGLAGAWGISKIKKTKKERAIKRTTADCMAVAGYSVDKWRVMSKREVRALESNPTHANRTDAAAVAIGPAPGRPSAEISPSVPTNPQ